MLIQTYDANEVRTSGVAQCVRDEDLDGFRRRPASWNNYVLQKTRKSQI